MNLTLNDEQRMLREAAKDALSRQDTIAAARAALDGAPLPDMWATAREAGWSGLLVAEEHGGAGLRAFDAMLVLEECGRRLAGAGLLGHLPATLVLQRAAQAGDEHAAVLLPALADGSRRAALVHARPPSGEEGWTVDRGAPAPRLRAEGILTGAAGFVLDAAGADVLVVAAVDEDGAPRAVVVEAGAAVEALVRYDASRPLAQVVLDGTPGRPVAAGAEALGEAWYVTQALLAADALGVAGATLDLAVAYAKERHAFGRPIGSFQAIKQQIVEMLRHAETTRSLTYYAAVAAQDRPEELALAASTARFAGEQAADYATRTCIAVHGGIGATWEHDAPLYWRRAQLSRLLLGGIGDAGDRVAEEIIARAREHAPAPTRSTMSTTTPAFDTSAIGTWGDPVRFAVERERIQAYAAATNDAIAPHAAGDLAPPVFAVVPAFGALAEASTKVIPGDLLMMVVHGEQDFRFHAPIRPDTTVATRAMPIGVQARSSGVTVTVKGETHDAATDELLVEQHMTSFVRGAQTDASTGEAPPPHGFPDQLREREPDAVVAQTFDADQTYRYSEASGDPMPIHLDDDLAKAMGLPGIIVHGLCTMAFTSVAVIGHACPDDPMRLRRLAVRFAKVVEPGQTISTRIHDAGEGRYAYETESDNGAVVIKDGLAEIR